MTNQAVPVIILAGGKNSPEMQAATGVENRALVALGERTMLDYVVQAFRAARDIESVTVVGDVPSSPDYTVVTPGDSMMSNLYLGIHAIGKGRTDSHAVISTSDIPFLTPEGVNDFVQQALTSGADLCYPIVPMDIYNTRFPEMKRTTLKLREGLFTGGNIVLLRPRLFLDQQITIAQAYAARKSVLKLGGMLGLPLLARLILSQTLKPSLLTIPLLEQNVARLISPECRVKAIITQYPEIGTDVDKPDDVAIARRLLAGSI